MKLRTHREALPRSPDLIIARVKAALSLSHVQEIRIRSNEFYVERFMDDDEKPVLPKTGPSQDIDVDFALKNVELLDSKFDPTKNPYVMLVDTTKMLTSRGLKISGIIAPQGEMFADYFGLAEGDSPEIFMGIAVTYHSSDKYPMKLVVLGGPTTYATDATHGIIIDMGI